MVIEQNYIPRSRLNWVLYFAFTALIICYPAFYNGFPLIYSDSGTYIDSMYLMTPPVDRPLGYGFFLRIVTWKSTLWLAVFAQGLIATLLLYRTLQTALQKTEVKNLHFITVLVLALLSPLSWVASQIMPDVFTSFMALAFYLLWYRKNHWLESILLAFVVFISVFSHFSNILLSSLFLVLLTIRWYKKRNTENNFHWIPAGIVAGCMFIAYMAQGILNAQEGRGFRYSTSGNVFFAAKLIEEGVMKEFLDENCGEKNYPLCKFKDSLPANSAQLVWDWNSILYKDFGGWESANITWGPMVTEIITRPKYALKICSFGLKHSLIQFFCVKIGDGITPLKEGTSPYNKILQRFGKTTLYDYVQGRQNSLPYDWTLLNVFWYIFLAISVAAIYFAISLGYSTGNLKSFIKFSLAVCVMNAFVCGTLTNHLDRYQSRVAWLIGLCGILCIFQMTQTIQRAWFQNEKNTNS